MLAIGIAVIILRILEPWIDRVLLLDYRFEVYTQFLSRGQACVSQILKSYLDLPVKNWYRHQVDKAGRNGIYFDVLPDGSMDLDGSMIEKDWMSFAVTSDKWYLPEGEYVLMEWPLPDAGSLLYISFSGWYR